MFIKEIWAQYKLSIIAFGITLPLGFFSMGLLGLGLYFIHSWALKLMYGVKRVDDFHGDAVWPILLLSGMAWSIGFLMAGWLNGQLERVISSIALRRMIYGLVLYLWSLIVVLWSASSLKVG